MAKVPHEFTGRTRPSAQPLALLNVQFTPEMFGAGLGQALGNFGQAFAVRDEYREATSRFDAVDAFTQFETDVKTQISQLQQDTTLDAANYMERAQEVYDNARNSFLNKLPSAHQREFQSRAEQVKQGVILDSLKFDYERRNLFYSTKIDDRLKAAQIELAQKPESLEAHRAKINELIDASGQTPIEKDRQKRIAALALESISYRADVKRVRKRELITGNGGISARNLPPEAAGVLGLIGAGESGGRYDVRYDGTARGARVSSFVDHPRQYSTITSGPQAGQKSSAAGKYQFIASTWDEVSRETGTTDFSPESQDINAWHLAQRQYRQTKGGDIADAIAREDWQSIKEALQVRWEAVRHMSASEVGRKFKQFAGAYGDYSVVESDPRFANVPLDQREALTRDAVAEADGEYKDLLNRQKLLEENDINDLYTGLYDGRYGQTQIDALRRSGVLRDYDDINKAQKILETRIGDNEDFLRGEAKLTAGGIWAPENADDKKAANALFNKGGGAEAVQSRNQDYVSASLLPRFEKMQMAAPDLVNTLTAMARNSNPQNSAYALETLRQMREVAPNAFAAQFDRETQAKVDFWEARRNYMPQEELVAQINNTGVDQATRQVQASLRSDVREMKEFKNLTADDAIYALTSSIPFMSPDVPITARASELLTSEYKALVEDNYVLYGNIAEAQEAASKQIARVWSVTTIGGPARVMKFPPEVAGYKQHNQSFAWIDKSVRTQLELPLGARYDLIADETTEQEIKQGIPASYLIWVKKDGYYKIFEKDGSPQRITFEVDKETLMEEEAAFREAQKRADEDAILDRANRDPAFVDEAARIRAERSKAGMDRALYEQSEALKRLRRSLGAPEQ